MSKKNYLKTARLLFEKRDFNEALIYFGLAFRESRYKKESEIGILLSDLALKDPDLAVDFFEFYNAIKKLNRRSAYSIVKTLIDNEDYEELEDSDEIHELAIDGINYDEFKLLTEKTKNFEDIFNKIISSTKIILRDKNELFNFLERLIENNHTKIALDYLDKISDQFVGEERVRELLEKIYDEIPNPKQ